MIEVKQVLHHGICTQHLGALLRSARTRRRDRATVSRCPSRQQQRHRWGAPLCSHLQWRPTQSIWFVRFSADAKQQAYQPLEAYA